MVPALGIFFKSPSVMETYADIYRAYESVNKMIVSKESRNTLYGGHNCALR